MAFSIKNNISAVNLSRQIDLSNLLLSKSMEKLASGLRINRASDDPAGLVISEQMRSRIASLNQEIENVSIAIRKHETASSEALQLRGILTEMRTLALAASNEAINDPAIQSAYQAEANRLVDSYNFIVENAAFGSQKLFDGSDGSLTTIPKMGELDLADSQAAQAAIGTIDESIGRLDSSIADIGSAQSCFLETRLANLRIEAENLTAAESQIRDTDYVLEFTNFLKNQMLLKSSTSLIAHSFITPRSVLALLVGR